MKGVLIVPNGGIYMEGIWHNGIREDISNKLVNKNFEIKKSHENEKICLFYREKARESWLSDADIIILKDNKVVDIIEIQQDVVPKSILGIISASDLCDRHIDKEGNEHLFRSPTLWIIVPDEVFKEGSKKKEQFEMLQKRYNKDGSLSNIKILTKDQFLSEVCIK